jgi:hypothetical protein
MFKNPQDPELYAFGMEVYVYLKLYCEMLKINAVDYDIRPFQILWEHKKCMLSRLDYIKSGNLMRIENSVYNSFKDIEQTSNILRNVMMKFDLTHDSKLIDKMLDLLDNLSTKEYLAICQLLS